MRTPRILDVLRFRSIEEAPVPVTTILSGQLLMMCPKCLDTVMVGTEILPAFCECGTELESMPCTECGAVATYMRKMGAERMGDGVNSYTREVEEPRCGNH